MALALLGLDLLLHPLEGQLVSGLCGSRRLADDVAYVAVALGTTATVLAAARLVRRRGPGWLAGGGLALLLVVLTRSQTTRYDTCVASSNYLSLAPTTPWTAISVAVALSGLLAVGLRRRI